VAQVLEHFPMQAHEALSSNANTTKRNYTVYIFKHSEEFKAHFDITIKIVKYSLGYIKV
jgi:hypothetical protein